MPKRYLSSLRPAFKAAEKGKIAVLGIKPRWPDTGFGYIEFPKGTEAGICDASRSRSSAKNRTPKTGAAVLQIRELFLERGHVLLEGGNLA